MPPGAVVAFRVILAPDINVMTYLLTYFCTIKLQFLMRTRLQRVFKAVMLTRTWDPRPRPRTKITRPRPRPSSIKTKAKAKDLSLKVKNKVRDSICRGQWQKKKTKANNDHKMMMTMMNKILDKQENSHSY